MRRAAASTSAAAQTSASASTSSRRAAAQGAHERVGKQRLGEQPCLGSNQKVHYVRSSSVLSFFVLYTYNNQQDGTAISNQQGVYGIMSI